MLATATSRDRARLVRIFGKDRDGKTAAELAFVRAAMDACGSIEFARALAHRLALRAEMLFGRDLRWLPASPHRRFLGEMIDYMITAPALTRPAAAGCAARYSSSSSRRPGARTAPSTNAPSARASRSTASGSPRTSSRRRLHGAQQVQPAVDQVEHHAVARHHPARRRPRGAAAHPRPVAADLHRETLAVHLQEHGAGAQLVHHAVVGGGRLGPQEVQRAPHERGGRRLGRRRHGPLRPP